MPDQKLQLCGADLRAGALVRDAVVIEPYADVEGSIGVRDQMVAHPTKLGVNGRTPFGVVIGIAVCVRQGARGIRHPVSTVHRSSIDLRPVGAERVKTPSAPVLALVSTPRTA